MLVLIVATGVLLVVLAAVLARRAPGPAAEQWSRWLQWGALAAAVVAAVALGPAAVRDSGWFAIVLLGVPVILAALPPLWDLTVGRGGGAVGWVVSVVAVGWALLLALGIGLAFLPAAFLMLAAAAARTATAAPLSSRA
jgi:hypothetical protein